MTLDQDGSESLALPWSNCTTAFAMGWAGDRYGCSCTFTRTVPYFVLFALGADVPAIDLCAAAGRNVGMGARP
jgi:hypothetical protein